MIWILKQPLTFFVLDLGLHVINGVGGLNFKCDGFPSEGFDEDLHTTSETQYQVKRRLFLDVVV